MHSLPSDAPAPRLCHLIKWPHFDGYGFNLHAEKSKSGQFVGKVDVGSPAEAAGLQEGDRIIEVNGVNIANENHRQVVERIKAVPNETKLLVLDIAGDDWYKERGIVVKGTQENVIVLKTPVAEDSQKEHIPESSHNDKAIDQITEEQQERLHGKEEGTSTATTTRREETPVVSANSGANWSRKTLDDQAEHASHGEENHTHKQQQEGLVDGVRALSCGKEDDRDEGSSSTESSSVPSSEVTVKHILNNNNIDAVKNHNSEQKSNCSVKETPNTNGGTVVNGESDVTDSPAVPASPTSLKSASSGASNGGHSSLDGSSLEMNLNMSVSQMRQLLAQKKKPDPKKVQMDLKEKYEIISSM